MSLGLKKSGNLDLTYIQYLDLIRSQINNAAPINLAKYESFCEQIKTFTEKQSNLSESDIKMLTNASIRYVHSLSGLPQENFISEKL